MKSIRSLSLPFLAIFLIAVALGAAAVYATQAFAEPGAPAELTEYRNDRWHFSLAVPDDMTVGVYDQPGDGQQFSFSNGSGSEVFTISAVPYSQLDLTLDRIGEPSGASDQPDHLEIVNIDRGDLFKVWFTKNGTLYVIVTLPEQEAQLTEILKSWQFTD